MFEFDCALPEGQAFATYSIGLGAERVDRENRVIYGVSVITRGEALGHGFWIDDVMLRQVLVDSFRRKKGVPMRWTHPSLCSDTMGKQVGRASNFVFDQDSGCIRADVFLYKKATGRRAEMIESILDLAEEDPEVFGLSIVFERDLIAEQEFADLHTDERGTFVSPDAENKNSLRHVRLAKLDWVDFVNEPAANPSGLFESFDTQDTMFRLFDSFLSGQAEPDMERRFYETFGISIGAAIGIFNLYLQKRGLRVAPIAQGPLTEPQRTVSFGAISYGKAHPNGTPKADENEPWNGSAEVAAADVGDMMTMCAWVEDGKSDLKTAYKFPHHKARKPHAVVWRAVANAAARLPQANIPSEDVPGVQRHLAAHYREFGKEPPFARPGADWAGYWSEVSSVGYPLSDVELCSLLEKYGMSEESEAIIAKNISTQQVEPYESIEVIAKILEDSIQRFRQLIGKE